MFSEKRGGLIHITEISVRVREKSDVAVTCYPGSLDDLGSETWAWIVSGNTETAKKPI